MSVNFRRLTPVDAMRGETVAETKELQAMLGRARDYLLSHKWCDSLSEEYFGFGVGEVVAVFLVKVGFDDGSEELLWVVEGDLPSAYFVTDCAEDPMAALEVYSDLMMDWVTAVRDGANLADVFPVQAAPTKEHTELLESRIDFLNKEVISKARDDG